MTFGSTVPNIDARASAPARAWLDNILLPDHQRLAAPPGAARLEMAGHPDGDHRAVQRLGPRIATWQISRMKGKPAGYR